MGIPMVCKRKLITHWHGKSPIIDISINIYSYKVTEDNWDSKQSNRILVQHDQWKYLSQTRPYCMSSTIVTTYGQHTRCCAGLEINCYEWDLWNDTHTGYSSTDHQLLINRHLQLFLCWGDPTHFFKRYWFSDLVQLISSMGVLLFS